jgi:hypothetical protein
VIARCAACTRWYWKYRSSTWETPGYCSWLCHDVRLMAKQELRAALEGPGIPVAIAEILKSHVRIVHRGAAEWNLGCPECERLEAQLAAAQHQYVEGAA